MSKIAGKVIRNYYDNLNKRDLLQNSSSSECKQILEKYSKIIDEAIENSFEKLPIYKKDIVKLAEIAGFLFCKDIFPKSLSGIVIAGFGVKDFFPKMRSYNFETIINGRLKYKDYIDGSIKHDQGAFMAPFAQGEMVHSFMKGIDPDLYKFTEEYLFNIFKEYPKIIVGPLKNLSQSEKDKITEKFNEFSKEVYNDFFKALNDVVARKFVDPIIDVVKILPKDELAAMAESLVNLTMFKQRVSPTAETVGGPIDVAIISKSDGFIWIKRKKYFDIELNPKYVIRRS